MSDDECLCDDGSAGSPVCPVHERRGSDTRPSCGSHAEYSEGCYACRGGRRTSDATQVIHTINQIQHEPRTGEDRTWRWRSEEVSARVKVQTSDGLPERSAALWAEKLRPLHQELDAIHRVLRDHVSVSAPDECTALDLVMALVAQRSEAAPLPPNPYPDSKWQGISKYAEDGPSIAGVLRTADAQETNAMLDEIGAHPACRERDSDEATPVACRHDNMCWRAEELVAEIFGIQDGAADGKTCGAAMVEVRRLVREDRQRRESPQNHSSIQQVMNRDMKPEKRLADLLVMIGDMQRHHALVAEESAIRAGEAKDTRDHWLHTAKGARDALFAKKLGELLEPMPELAYMAPEQPGMGRATQVHRSLDQARVALADLHSLARGHGSNIDANKWWSIVDDALDELNELRPSKATPPEATPGHTCDASGGGYDLRCRGCLAMYWFDRGRELRTEGPRNEAEGSSTGSVGAAAPSQDRVIVGGGAPSPEEQRDLSPLVSGSSPDPLPRSTDNASHVCPENDGGPHVPDDVKDAHCNGCGAWLGDGLRALCTKAPAGWSCSRDENHDGPCAARPTAPTPSVAYGGRAGGKTAAMLVSAYERVRADGIDVRIVGATHDVVMQREEHLDRPMRGERRVSEEAGLSSSVDKFAKALEVNEYNRAFYERVRRETIEASEARVRALWAESYGWCACRDANGLERVVAALKGGDHHGR